MNIYANTIHALNNLVPGMSFINNYGTLHVIEISDNKITVAYVKPENNSSFLFFDSINDFVFFMCPLNKPIAEVIDPIDKDRVRCLKRYVCSWVDTSPSSHLVKRMIHTPNGEVSYNEISEEYIVNNFT